MSPENIHIGNIICNQQIIWNQHLRYRNTHVYANRYMHAVTIDEEKGHELEGEWGGVWGCLEQLFLTFLMLWFGVGWSSFYVLLSLVK